MALSFEDFFKELCSNHVWFEPASMRHKPETFRDICRQVHEQYLARELFPPIQEARSFVSNKLNKINPDKVKVDWAAKALEKVEAEQKQDWVPLTGEERTKRLKEWESVVKGSTMANALPKPSYKQLAEEGGVLPPKPAPYPCTSKEEAYIRDRHFEYIKHAFEPRTGLRKPDTLSEEEFNIQYDNNML